MSSEENIKPKTEPVLPESQFSPLQDYSREQLEEEIHLLRITVADMKANSGIRTEFGFLRSEPFFERAEEEFSRSRRYSSPLTLVVVTMLGYENIKQTLGAEACEHYVAKLAQKCTDSCREGADILGLIGKDQFGILLPEANIDGCTRFKERLKGELSASSINWNNSPIKAGVKISAGILLGHDESFDELYKRTTEQKIVLENKVA